MKRFSLKLTGILLCFSFIFPILTGAGLKGQTAETVPFSLEIQEQIAAQIVEQTKSSGDYEIVAFEQASANGIQTDTANAAPAEYMLKTVEQDGDDVAVTTLIPYTVDEETGDLVNSFAYVASPKASISGSWQKEDNFNDVIIKTVARYTRVSDTLGTIYYYRHTSVETTWMGSAAPYFKISSLTAEYITQGDLVGYPDCLNASPKVLQYDYSVKSIASKASPVMGTKYSDTSHAMPSNRVVHLADLFDDGGYVYVRVSYYNQSTGQSRSKESGYKIYSK